MAALADVGGVNSIRSFTRSWQRAAAFPEVIPQRPAFVFAPDQEPIAAAPESIRYGRSDIETGRDGSRSLLRDHFEPLPPDIAVQDESPVRSPTPGASDQPLLEREQTSDFREREERKALGDELTHALTTGSMTSNSIFSIPPHLASPPPILGSYGSYRSYGTIVSDITGSSMAGAAELWRRQQEARVNVPDGGVAPIMVKEVEQDGKIVLTVEGQSTLPQTIFNSTKYALPKFQPPRPPRRGRCVCSN